MAGCVREIVEWCLDDGYGIIQLPCPEEHAWGGVRKRRLLALYGARGTLPYGLRGLLLPLAVLYTRLIYRRLAQAGRAGDRGLPSRGIHGRRRRGDRWVAFLRRGEDARPARIPGAAGGGGCSVGRDGGCKPDRAGKRRRWLRPIHYEPPPRVQSPGDRRAPVGTRSAGGVGREREYPGIPAREDKAVEGSVMCTDCRVRWAEHAGRAWHGRFGRRKAGIAERFMANRWQGISGSEVAGLC